MTAPLREPGRDPLADIADAADALTNPRHHSEPRYVWDEHRNRKPVRPHQTVVPGLVQQLRELAEPGVDGDAGGRGGAESCPVAIDAVSLLASIEFGVAWRVMQIGIERRPTAEDNIRALVGAAGRLPYEADRPDQASQRALRAELRSWQHQAEVIAGWRMPARALPAPCPVPDCGAHGSLLVRADTLAAWCTACGARWDADTVGVLGSHVIEHRKRAEAEAVEARSRAVAERRRREGRPHLAL